MAGINENKGPGWGDHNTPYGTVHSYTDPGTHMASGNGGNNHTNIGPKTLIRIITTKDYDGAFMSQCLNNLKNHEGFRNKMYADTKGNVTVGIGRLLGKIEDALNMPFKYIYHKTGAQGSSSDNEMSATPDQIRKEYNNVHENPKYTSSIHLSNDEVIKACIDDVKKIESGLRGLYKNYDNFTNNAKTGLIDIGFNIGISNLKNKFPHFNEAVNRGDWNTAAKESHREGISQERNNDTAENFNKAALGH